MPPDPFDLIDTPALLLDEARMTRNIDRLVARAAALGVQLRPHIKTAKSEAVARRLLDGPIGAATVSTLAEAEVSALRQTCQHADLQDGQNVLELGCGWGSLSLWMARHYPASTITAVSNSRSQKAAIDAEAARLGLTNLTVVTADMNVFQTEQRFDRIVSVEMFEHMANWRELLGRVRAWLKPDGRVFIHVFSHVTTPYRFEVSDKADFIAQHFFTGGIMPSHGLMRQYPDLFEVEQDWRWSGTHYQRTANHWLENFDRHETEIRGLMKEVYGADYALWMRRWRRFFMATAGLFGDSDGQAWGVSHYRLKGV